jgi:hypothetical protein
MTKLLDTHYFLQIEVSSMTLSSSYLQDNSIDPIVVHITPYIVTMIPR